MLTSNFIFSCLMNGGNYFLNTKTFTTILQPYSILRPYAADSLLKNYIWLSHGNKLKVLSNASYYHRIHSKSNWILNRKKGLVSYLWLANKFQVKQPATLENLLLQFENIVGLSREIKHIPL
jgi:hypothetical protein